MKISINSAIRFLIFGAAFFLITACDPVALFEINGQGLETDTVVINIRDTMHLDASASYDPRRNIITHYDWEVLESPGSGFWASSLVGEGTVKPYILPEQGVGIYEIQLVVGANRRSSKPTQKTVVVEPNYVIARVTPTTTTTDVKSILTLDGSNSQPDPALLDFFWTIKRVPALSSLNSASLQSPNSQQTSLVIDEPGTYHVQLYVELRDDPSQNDETLVDIYSYPPQIFSIQPTQGPVGTEVTIKGKNFSSHVEGNNVSFNNIAADQILTASDTMLKVVVPENATTGQVKVGIVESGDEITSNSVFTIGALGPVTVLTTPHRLLDVSFANQNNGIAVGNDGAIFVTTDGGHSWSQKASGASYQLRSVSFISNTAFAVGTQGTILKSTDGGDSWNPLPSSTNGQLTGVSFANATTGYACGKSPDFLEKTTDGGTTWQEVIPSSNGGFDDVFFLDETNGFATGIGFYFTNDGGQSWGNAQSGVNNGHNYNIHFIDNQKGWIAGTLGDMAYTSNGGLNFTPLTGLATNTLSDIHFFDEDHGIAVGYFDTILKTTDGGANWELVDLGLSNYHFLAVTMLQTDHIILLGQSRLTSEGVIFLMN